MAAAAALQQAPHQGDLTALEEAAGAGAAPLAGACSRTEEAGGSRLAGGRAGRQAGRELLR